MVTPTRRRFSYAGSYRKCNSVESSNVFSAYPIDESFDYYLESDGEEADDEFDQITHCNDPDVRMQQLQHSMSKSPQRVCTLYHFQAFYLLTEPKYSNKKIILCSTHLTGT